MAKPINFFLPCFLVVGCALFLAATGYASRYVAESSFGDRFTPAPTPGPPTLPPPTASPPLSLAVRAPQCSLDVCVARESAVDECADIDGVPCELDIDGGTLLCALGRCADARCTVDARQTLPYTCGCTCPRRLS